MLFCFVGFLNFILRLIRVIWSYFPLHFLLSHHLPQVLQCCRHQHATEQKQREDVGVQQQGAGQALERVQGKQAKGLLTQIQTGIKIPAGEARGGHLFVFH